MCKSHTVYITLFYHYITIITMYLILKLLIINHLININTISCTINYKLMYLSDCNNIQYKEATKLVNLNDKVKPHTINNYKHRSKPKILQRVGNNLNYIL